MTATLSQLSQLLGEALSSSAGTRPETGANSRVDNLHRLSGGANMETWSFDWEQGSQSTPLILRRLPATSSESNTELTFAGAIGLPTEAALLGVAGIHQVSVPQVILVLGQEHQLGTGYIMSREHGEALPFRILADDRYATARTRLAYQCGEMLGHIHQIPMEELPPGLRDIGMDEEYDRQQALLDSYGNTSAVHQIALNWLRENKPEQGRRCLVHGDFRNGNLLVDEQGLVAVLDWELAHIGEPAQDLGYLCGNVWRFGKSNKPVGGFGEYQQLLDGYHSVTGDMPSLREIHYWEVYTALSWGVVCLTMIDMHRSGQSPGLERAAVGRRMSESEIDLLLLLEEGLGV